MGLFTGSRPKKLGFENQKFARDEHRNAWKPNWVSSTLADTAAKNYIAPLSFTGNPAKAWARMVEIATALPRCKVVAKSESYLHLEVASKAMGFTDDLEFALDVKGLRIHARSGARLGVRDFGMNRKHVEAVRRKFASV